MSAPWKLAAFAALLAGVFAIATIAGAELDPGVDSPHDQEEDEINAHVADPPNPGDETEAAREQPALPGLAVAQDGYRLIADRTLLAEARETFAFRIVDASGETVEDFDVEHQRRMHLIVVRRDFANFQHLHPRQLEDGSWEVEVDLDPAGTYRAFADFATEGASLTLGTDLSAPGRFEPQALPAPASVADAGGGYEVTIDSKPRAGGTSEARFTISLDGRTLDSVEPYLGADGHLVALREHDQAYLHTHPEGEPGGSGPITFQVEYPTPGRYRLFLQFRHRGEIHTAAFTQDATGKGATGAAATGAENDDHGDDDGH